MINHGLPVYTPDYFIVPLYYLMSYSGGELLGKLSCIKFNMRDRFFKIYAGLCFISIGLAPIISDLYQNGRIDHPLENSMAIMALLTGYCFGKDYFSRISSQSQLT